MRHKIFVKKSLALLLVLVMCLGMLQTTAFAAEDDATSADETQETPEVEKAETTEVEKAETLEVEKAETLEVEKAEPPEAEVNKAPKPEKAEPPKAEKTETPADNGNVNVSVILTNDADDDEVIDAPKDGDEVINTPEDGDEDIPEIEDKNHDGLPDFPVNGTEEEQQEWYKEHVELVEHPEQTKGLDTSTGTDKDIPAEPIEDPKDQDWSVFWNEETKKYELTYEIDENAEGDQTIDLTKALDLLGKYAESGKSEAVQKELHAAIDAIVKPEKGDAGDAPEKGDAGDVPEKGDAGKAPIEPKKPDVDFDQEEPEPPADFDQEEPTEPVEPGKPEGLDEATQSVWDKVYDYFSSGEGNDYNNTQNVLKELEAAGVDPESKYAKDYAQYVVNKADNAFLIKVFETRGKVGSIGMFKCFMQWESSYNGSGEPTEEQIAQAIASVQSQDARLSAPEYPIDKESDEYKAYEAAKSEYDDAKANYDEAKAEYDEAMAKYELEKAAYDAAFKAYMAEHGPESEESKAYAEQVAKYERLKAEYDAKVAEIEAEYEAAMAEYNAKVAEIEAEYEAAMAEYNAKMAEIEAKYADDKAKYDAEVAALRADHKRRLEANILQPGDIRNFEIYITTKSGHTYKYKDGSFTLTTPNVNVDGTGVFGFDGQELGPDHNGHIGVNQDYNVSAAMSPIQQLLVNAGLSEGKVNYESKASHDTFADMLAYLANYGGENAENAVKAALDDLGVEYTYSYNPKSYMPHSFKFDGQAMTDAVKSYLVKYYSGLDGVTYADMDEVFAKSTAARNDVTSSENVTQADKHFSFGGDDITAHYTASLEYNNFYQHLLSFIYGDVEDIERLLGAETGTNSSNHPEYDNSNWSSNYEDGGLALDYSVVLEQYMAHLDAWDAANDYFVNLLANGLSTNEATGATLAKFAMSLNLDGEAMNNRYQLTKWGWNNSIQLEQIDIDFNLTKKDENDNTISTKEDGSPNETGFQIWCIDSERGKLYCTSAVDDEGNVSYTFQPADELKDGEDTVWTKNGELNIDYAMMKDIVYYLQEKVAPEGYTKDTNIYIVMSEDEYNNLTDEEKDELENFDKFLDLTTTTSENGVVSKTTDFVNVKIVPQKPTPPPPPPPPEDPPEDPEDPPEDPEDPPKDPPEDPEDPPKNPPEDPEDPPRNPPEDPEDPPRNPPESPKNPPEDPEPPTPETEIPEEPVPLTETPEEEIEIPDEDVPLAELPDEPDEEIEIPDEDVPLGDVPRTGDASAMWYTLTLLSAAGLVCLAAVERKKRQDA